VSSTNRFQIPIVDLRAQYATIRDQVRQAIDEVNDSQQFILGPAVSKFEAQMADYTGCDHAVGIDSGSDALLLALMALDVGPGDAVITTPFTFFSTVSSITRLGAAPLFVDIDPLNERHRKFSRHPRQVGPRRDARRKNRSADQGGLARPSLRPVLRHE
jgi:histidinol-phosphate/aromatic aminotransferase/cobyric acid decarboxylase-like protein